MIHIYIVLILYFFVNSCTNAMECNPLLTLPDATIHKALFINNNTIALMDLHSWSTVNIHNGNLDKIIDFNGSFKDAAINNNNEVVIATGNNLSIYNPITHSLPLASFNIPVNHYAMAIDHDNEIILFGTNAKKLYFYTKEKLIKTLSLPNDNNFFNATSLTINPTNNGLLFFNAHYHSKKSMIKKTNLTYKGASINLCNAIEGSCNKQGTAIIIKKNAILSDLISFPDGNDISLKNVWFNSMKFHPDRSVIPGINAHGIVEMYDFTTQKFLTEIVIVKNNLNNSRHISSAHVLFSPDGKYFLTLFRINKNLNIYIEPTPLQAYCDKKTTTQCIFAYFILTSYATDIFIQTVPKEIKQIITYLIAHFPNTPSIVTHNKGQL